MRKKKFTLDDTSALFRLMKRSLPMDSEEWETLAQNYKSMYAVPNKLPPRDARSLQGRFKAFCQLSTPIRSTRRRQLRDEALHLKDLMAEKVGW